MNTKERGQISAPMVKEQADPALRSIPRPLIPPNESFFFFLPKKSLWRTEEYYLVAVLYDASMIDRRRFSWKSISFEVSLGNAGNRQFSHSQCFDDNNDGIGFSSIPSLTIPFKRSKISGSLLPLELPLKLASNSRSLVNTLHFRSFVSHRLASDKFLFL